MKKKAIERELKRLRRVQREMLEREATVMVAVLRLQDGVYEPDDDDSDEVEVPNLRVVGDG